MWRRRRGGGLPGRGGTTATGSLNLTVRADAAAGRTSGPFDSLLVRVLNPSTGVDVMGQTRVPVGGDSAQVVAVRGVPVGPQLVRVDALQDSGRLVGFGTATVEIAPGVAANVVITLFPPGRLSFLTQPANTAIGTAFSPAVRVAVLNEDGQPDSGADDAVTLAGSALSGAVTVHAVNGVATFANVAPRCWAAASP